MSGESFFYGFVILIWAVVVMIWLIYDKPTSNHTSHQYHQQENMWKWDIKYGPPDTYYDEEE